MSNGQMRLYTSTGTRKTIEKCNANNIGLLMVDHWRNPDDWPFFAVDNGCFASYHRKEVWNPAPFMNILSKCKERGYIPDFIVIPDKVADKGSLAFSRKWIPILSELYPRFPKYLAVQDGMTALDIATAIYPDWTPRELGIKKNQVFGILYNAERWDQVKRVGVTANRSILWVKT